MIQGFGQEITEIPAFGHDITEVRAMGKLAWQKQSSIPDYLCFTALESGTFTLTIPAAVTATSLSYVEWSKDGRTWNHTDNTSEAVTIDVQVTQGDKVYWRGSGSRMAYDYTANKYSVFSFTGTFDVSGDLRSLLFADDFENVTTTNQQYCFTGLFYGASVVDASNLRLALTGLGAYMYCFRGCTQLLHAPALMEGNTIMQWQFHSTYQDCTNLITGTDLQATSVGVRGCYYTYRSCKSLVKAPNISSITTIGNSGLCAMFHDCTNLSYVKCLATSLYDDGDASHFATSNWLIGVSSTGTFIQAEGVEWPRGASGIPTGWLAYDEGEEIPNDYTLCDYIYNSSQSGGGVDLGFKFRLLDYSVEAKFKQDTVSNGMVIGTKNNDNGAIWFYNYTSADSFRTIACYSSGWKYNVNGFMPLDTNTHIICYVGDADGCYQISDGTQSGIHDISTWAAEESTDNLFIFGRAASTNTYKGGIYYLWVKDNSTDEYICNLIPCSRKSDGAAGYWDTAQKKFFTSTYWTAHFDNE